MLRAAGLRSRAAERLGARDPTGHRGGRLEPWDGQEEKLRTDLIARIASTRAMPDDQRPDLFPELDVFTEELKERLVYLSRRTRPLRVTLRPACADPVRQRQARRHGSAEVSINPDAPRDTLSASTVGFLEFHGEVTPADQLAYHHGRLLDHRTAMPLYRQVALMKPDHFIGYYNVACVSALQGDFIAALAALARIADNPPAAAGITETLTALHHDPDFTELLAVPEMRARFRELEQTLFPDLTDAEWGIQTDEHYSTF